MISKNKGVAAVEFGFVFLLMFFMMYALITYCLIFFIQHSLSLASAEGARAAVRFQSNNDTLANRQNAACSRARESLQAIERLLNRQSTCASDGVFFVKINTQNANCSASSVNCVSVLVSYNYKANPIIPTLSILPVPQYLKSESFTQIVLRY